MKQNREKVNDKVKCTYLTVRGGTCQEGDKEITHRGSNVYRTSLVIYNKLFYYIASILFC
jgi:hypothetical protein